MTAKERLALEVDLEGAEPPEVPYPEVEPEDPSPFHAVARWVAAMWPWCRFAGITARMWPYLGGKFLREAVDLGPLGWVWTDGPKTLWAWQPRGGSF
ncbi:hypothetical protein [Thermus thermophilus]|uniref:Uncharacterized protein n=1 Tax=Thermus thermophilus TaxID=274 RepID=A0AAD1KTZ0_THETH|nr:hypothetical protein [Thermus thermophilus]BCZ86921.1 hypothetical protein TthAA11_11030 [Thermus thermophilus]